jgi:hypothetical protein
LQAFIESFEYNYTGTNFFNVTGVKNDQSLMRVLSIAKECKSSFPIAPNHQSLLATMLINISIPRPAARSSNQMRRSSVRAPCQHFPPFLFVIVLPGT